MMEERKTKVDGKGNESGDDWEDCDVENDTEAAIVEAKEGEEEEKMVESEDKTESFDIIDRSKET
jgi:hypothetical protein